jgi:hypothetical protein
MELKVLGELGEEERKKEGDVTLILKLFTYDVTGALQIRQIFETRTASVNAPRKYHSTFESLK